jgi:hypothetical protein
VAVSISGSDEEQQLCARFVEAMQALVNVDENLVRRGRTLNLRCLVQIGSTAFQLRIEDGGVRECRSALRPLTSWTFAIRGSLSAWANLWQQTPAPGWHDLLALSKRGVLSIEGDLQPFMAHLQYFKDLLSLPRKTA